MKQDLNVNRWAKTDLWSITEAPLILLGQDPDSRPDGTAKIESRVIMEWMLKAVVIGALRPIRNIDALPAFVPTEVIAWAKTKDVVIPANLEHAVQTAALATLKHLPLPNRVTPVMKSSLTEMTNENEVSIHTTLISASNTELESPAGRMVEWKLILLKHWPAMIARYNGDPSAREAIQYLKTNDTTGCILDEPGVQELWWQPTNGPKKSISIKTIQNTISDMKKSHPTPSRK